MVNEKVAVLEGKFDISRATETIANPEAGGYVIFLGKVRNQSRGRKVLKLIYEVYDEMAVEEMKKIREEALKKFGITDMLIWHRRGELKVEEDTILVVASAPHRKEAFEACMWAVDEVKKRVPVWKKEITEEGAFWIEGDKAVPAKDYHGK
ncbi:molybdenum cofactor biosynthesis protein MoaE [Thermococcus waiotapuensis]|uniref:Molybdenum cofactor biosynthesis protein MoaE n=1 Tax=Thermococcus waiotapuensis TaxID=90909 RepID=A0AAE4NW52_9EURY|nr:molybdenum cofactor biosynthesis protein MoaE [Thermococcus waiotapuensis]MDV3103770.1 molybdenum cofactor biosynthesis protein MoaE [Thermococcus waiotapuensis]